MAEQYKNVHYFPGHMAKALDKMEPLLKLADIVVEVADARAPVSSRNPTFASLIGDKPHLLVLSKSDRADPAATQEWLSFYRQNGVSAVSADLKQDKLLASLLALAEPLAAPKRAKEARLGMKKQPLRLLVAGIPNVGKSTLINNLAGRALTQVANRPGVTRAEQWIRLPKDFVLLDTPGILPMSYPDGAQAVRLALLGSIKEEVLPTFELALALLGYLREAYPLSLARRYGIADLRSASSEAVLETLASTRGFLSAGGTPDEDKAALALLKDFQDGSLGRLSLERA